MLDFSSFSGRKEFFSFFEEISKIPRGSGNCKGIADYLENFAKERNLAFARDNTDTVLIKKDATKGYENAPTIILQGHSDMVIATNEEYEGDILKDGVKPYIDGEFLRAKGSTLGGDNGIAVAYMLAILDSDTISHPPIEAIFTSDEETGLYGASGFDASLVKGKTLINIDGGSDGVFIAGCAGGERIDISKDFSLTEADGCYEISISGLKGGHSGCDIHKGHLNAIKLISEIASDVDMIGDIHGGTVNNAITDSATFSVSLDDNIEEKIDKLLAKWRKTEENIKIECKKQLKKCYLIDKVGTKDIIRLLRELPFGPTEMSEISKSIPKTSANLGVTKTTDTRFELTVSIRSSSDTSKENLKSRIISIANSIGANFKCHEKYPGWEYSENSKIRDILSDTYKELYHKDAKTITIHAGLECGIFASKIDGLDCISIGPNQYNLHNPQESLSIPSAIRCYGLILTALRKIKT